METKRWLTLSLAVIIYVAMVALRVHINRRLVAYSDAHHV